MNLLNTAPSNLPPPSVMSYTAPAEPSASTGTPSETSQFAKILQQRQSTDKPTEQPPERTAAFASKANTASAPPPAHEPKDLQGHKATAASGAATTAAAHRPAKKQPAATEMEQAQTLGLDADTSSKKPELLTPESNTPTLAQRLPETVPVAVSITHPLAVANAGSTSAGETATNEDVTLLSDSWLEANSSTAPPTALAAPLNQPAQTRGLPGINLATDSPTAPQNSTTALETQTLEQQGLASARLASSPQELQRANDQPRLMPEASTPPPLNPTLMPMLGDALKGLALLSPQDKPHRANVGDVGPLPSLASAPTALMPPLNQLTPTLALASPVNGPEFKEALATQVVMLVKDGIQQASLQLNPAHMGPISIQISLEGTQTHVEFASDSALTRQIIEAGLPELAGALREAGLTLSGGGVSQHSSQSAQQDAASRQPNPALRGGSATEDESAGLPSAPLLSMRMNQGGLDLYA